MRRFLVLAALPAFGVALICLLIRASAYLFDVQLDYHTETTLDLAMTLLFPVSFLGSLLSKRGSRIRRLALGGNVVFAVFAMLVVQRATTAGYLSRDEALLTVVVLPTSCARIRSGPVIVDRHADGHFYVEGSMAASKNSHSTSSLVQPQSPLECTTLRFRIDENASGVLLAPDNAVRLGLNPAQLAYDMPVKTSVGAERAARVAIDSFEIHGSEFGPLDAFVLQAGTRAVIGIDQFPSSVTRNDQLQLIP